MQFRNLNEFQINVENDEDSGEHWGKTVGNQKQDILKSVRTITYTVNFRDSDNESGISTERHKGAQAQRDISIKEI